MRRVSYTFPRTCDLEFEIPLPFSAAINAMGRLAERQDNFKTEIGPVKRDFTVKIAANRTGFEVLSRGAVLSPSVTDEADFLVNIYDTVLSAAGHKPVTNSDYMIKFLDRGNHTEVFVTGANPRGMQKIIMGLF